MKEDEGLDFGFTYYLFMPKVKLLEGYFDN